MTDTRTENANHHRTDENGKVVAVHATVHERPGTRWRCRSVRLIDEYEAQGQTIIYNIFSLVDGVQPVFLLTGYQGNPDLFDQKIPDTSGKGELVMAGNGAKFSPPNLGPLAVCVGDYDSDIVANLGLPNGHHVSYAIDWELRRVDTGTESNTITLDLDPDASKLAELEQRVAALEKVLGLCGGQSCCGGCR